MGDSAPAKAAVRKREIECSLFRGEEERRSEEDYGTGAMREEGRRGDVVSAR